MNRTSYTLGCSYIPRELLEAAGNSCCREWPSDTGETGQGYLPYDFCPYSRAFLSRVLDRKKPVIFANSCDAMRRVYDIIPGDRFLLEVPRKTGDSYREYYYSQLRELLAYLGKDYNRQVRQGLQRQISLHNKYRSRLKSIMMSLLKKGCSFQSFFRVLELYNRGDYRALVARGSVCEAGKDGERPGVLVVSSCILERELINLIESVGLRVVGLDSCYGERYFNFQIIPEHPGDPLQDIARGYLNKPPCPRTMEPERRRKLVEGLAEARKAGGIIYFIPKFCDQGSYDFRLIKGYFQKQGLPVLKIEGEYNLDRSGQLTTRLEAFCESLKIKV
ncbi:MAG: 2-hydroxyacyl-CoA dehydratase family protein [Bacillota bacterium]